MQAYSALYMCEKTPTSFQLKSFWDDHGLGDDDTINLDLFRQLCDKVSDLTEEEFRESLKKFDKDNNGKISANELRSILMAQDTILGTSIADENDEAMEEIITRLDLNGDGVLDIEELTRAIMTYGDVS
ncbi:calmodulin-like isoform X2 [Dreissena polymorpha]|nr:calmodulin-like isoform X2 [Dreissena polymorpha]